jgi:hypothetical protein
MRLGCFALLLLGLASCISHPDSPTLPPDNTGTPIPPIDTQGSNSTATSKGQQQQQQQPTNATALQVLREEVYLVGKGYDGEDWICTGSLVAKNIVVTAAHCLEDGKIENWKVIAPHADGSPQVTASTANRMSDGFDDVSQPDIGLLWLDQDIVVPTYAVLTDVTDRIAKGEKLTATVVVRTAEERDPPMKEVDNLNVQSTVDRGYDHGIATQNFSHGGDSGAGLFLVENGQVTHKLIGVARQPEQSENLDHFTRIDSDVLQWFHDATGD